MRPCGTRRRLLMDTTALPLFMSARHVAEMNRRLAASPLIVDVCARLERPLRLAYALSVGPGGSTVHWTVTADRAGLRFGLGEPSEGVDLLVESDWADMIRTVEADRRGEAPPANVVPPRSTAGSPDAAASIAHLLTVAKPVATVPVRFPDLDGSSRS